MHATAHVSAGALQASGAAPMHATAHVSANDCLDTPVFVHMQPFWGQWAVCSWPMCSEVAQAHAAVLAQTPRCVGATDHWHGPDVVR